jgi:hypothetical protein
MVISCVIKGFLVHNILVDTGSATDIIFEKAFWQIQEQDDKIHDVTHPLCGFGGRQIVALGKITMPITFGYVHNTRMEQVVLLIWNILTMHHWSRNIKHLRSNTSSSISMHEDTIRPRSHSCAWKSRGC